MKTLSNYRILTPLGDGYSGEVMMAENLITGQKVALKSPTPKRLHRYPNIAKLFSNEYRVLSQLHHPGIINLIEYQAEIPYGSSEAEKSKMVPLMILELAPNGEMCSIICETGKLNENMARFYFKQLLETLEYIHEKGFAHRDIKPENILLEKDYNLKLVDFAFAVEAKEQIKNVVGTFGYLSPEAQDRRGFNGFKADIFAAGVVLFIFVRGIPPFNDANATDPHFNALRKNPSSFWAYHKTIDPSSPISSDFQILFQGLVETDPNKRMTIKEALESKWLKESINEEKAKLDMKEKIKRITKRT